MWAIMWREFKLHYTKIYWLISNFISPLFYLLFFGLLFSRAITYVSLGSKYFSYLHFFIPGLMVMQSFFVLSYTLALVNLDRRTGIIQMVRSTSTHFYEYFWGRWIGVQFLIFVKILLLWVIAFLFFDLSVGHPFCVFSVIITLSVSNFIWFSIGFLGGLIIKTEDVRDIILQLISLPLTFLSNIYYPINNAPGILKYIIEINPLTHTTNLIRPALLGISSYNIISALVLIIYFLIVLVLVWFFFRKWSWGE